MRKKIDYIIESKIINKSADIQFEYQYQDDFSNDHYLFKNIGDEKNGVKKLNFEVYKNGELLMMETVNNKDFSNLFDNFIKKTEDFDFNTEFKEKFLEKTKQDLNEFVINFDRAILSESFTLKGETKRMVEIANYLK